MRKESREAQKLHDYQVRCSEQQDIIEMLEREIANMMEALSSAVRENRRLTALLAEYTPEENGENEPKEKNSEDKEEPCSQEEYDGNPFDEVRKREEHKEDSRNKKESDECPFDLPMFTPEKRDEPDPWSYKSVIKNECRDFLERRTFSDFYNEISKEIIGQEAGLKNMLAIIYNYISVLATGEKPEKCTAVILTAPSGNGKTALVKALSHYFETEIPALVCSRKDASRVSPEGYKGDTISSLLTDFYDPNNRRNEQKYGLLWLDEFDKVWFNRETGVATTNQLLALMDGYVDWRNNIAIDTGYILWIVMGSFNEIRERKRQAAEKTIGFTSRNEEYDAFDDITREDMLKMFSYETVGRFSLVVNLKRLSREAVAKVIAKTMDSIGKSLRINVILGEEYMNKLIQSANSEFGCRQIYSTLYEPCLQAYINILQSGNYGINNIPTVLIEGKNEYCIIDGAIADLIEFK